MSNSEQREVKPKNIFLVYFFSIITFGIYGMVWTVKSKRDMNSLGAEITTSWLLIVPMANIFWLYKYFEGFANHIVKDEGTVKWFAIHIVTGGILTQYIVQAELNKFSQIPEKKLVESKPERHVRAA